MFAATIVAPEEVGQRSLGVLCDRLAYLKKALEYSGRTHASQTCWALAYTAVQSGVAGLVGVSVFGPGVVAAMEKGVLVPGLGFVRTTIKLDPNNPNNLGVNLGMSKLAEVCFVLDLSLLLVEEGTMTEDLPSKPDALCRAFARKVLEMFEAMCGFVDALLVAKTSDKTLVEVTKYCVTNMMLVLAWVVEDDAFASLEASTKRKYTQCLIEVVLRLLNCPTMALAAHASAILEVLKKDLQAKHFKLLRAFLEKPVKHGKALQDVRESVANLLLFC